MKSLCFYKSKNANIVIKTSSGTTERFCISKNSHARNCLVRPDVYSHNGPALLAKIHIGNKFSSERCPDQNIYKEGMKSSKKNMVILYQKRKSKRFNQQKELKRKKALFV